MLEKLSEGLKEALRKITRAGYVDKKTLDELGKDIQTSLLASDVNVKLALEITEKIKHRALNEKPPSGLTAKEHVIRIVYDELVKFVGRKPEISYKQGKILFIGLFGSGKTTSIGKIARFYQKRGMKVAIVGCDVHRPAAMDQIQQVAKQINIPVYAPKDIKDPIEIARRGIDQFRKYDIVIFDSSGRDALDKELANELKRLGEFIKPQEVLLVVPADLGQIAGKQAEEFNKLVGITGVFLTKMDGTARGGGALTSCAVINVPIKFIGIGEKLDALEIFDPERFISKLIGFGDIQGLLEKAKELMEPGMKETAEKIVEGKMTMNEFYEQIKGLQKMGSLQSIMGSIPGMGMMKLPKEFDVSKQEDKMKKWKYIIESMSKEEKNDPDIINPSRIKRIAKGSGTSEADVRELLKFYSQSKKMIKMFTSKRGIFSKLTKKFKGF